MDRNMAPMAIRTVDGAKLRQALSGEVILPSDGAYDQARRVWNGMVDRHPSVVVRPRDAADVATAVRLARDADLPLAIRGGGHSLPGLSTCDDGLVIDLSLMRGVTVDPTARTARVDGGALLVQLDEAAQKHGLVCPVGVVGHTGVAGLTLGGWLGRLQRHWGYSIDNMLAVDLVTADGKQIRASEEENPDLFWGVRGAGPNFGIVTAFEFRLHELGQTVTQGVPLFAADRAHRVGARVREWAPTAPDELMTSFGFGMATPEPPFPTELAGQPVVYMAATHSGAPDGAGEALRPLRDLGPLVDTIEPRRYLDVQPMADEEMAWGTRV